MSCERLNIGSGGFIYWNKLFWGSFLKNFGSTSTRYISSEKITKMYFDFLWPETSQLP